MGVSEADLKLLWGRAAGFCSNPTCSEDLTELLATGGGYNVGEMAHVIAKSPDGPRGVAGGGSDSYENLILLCPTCHRRIDKAPDGEFPAELLHGWKRDHEAATRRLGANEIYRTLDELKSTVARMLQENYFVWKNLGPRSTTASTDPGSNLFVEWDLRKFKTIIPNNRRIINIVEANEKLLSAEDYDAFLAFKTHAEAFETHQYQRLDSYPLFPKLFARIFGR